MQILVVGVNHKTAPVEVRERLAIPYPSLKEGLEALKRYISPAALLSTCNRTEVYAMAEKPALASDKITRFLSYISNLPPFAITPLQYSYQGQEAVRHLFRVASGLDSMVFGEAQVLGQVRQALEAAKAQGTLSLPLAHLFRCAVRVGRRARQETEIGRNAASVSSAGVELACRSHGHPATARATVVGAGRMARRAAQNLLGRSVREVTIANRTYERAAALAQELGLKARPFPELAEALKTSDIAITATSSTEYLLSVPLIKEVMAQRPGRPLILVDIAVPRNIDPAVRKMKNVSLFDIDDLTSVAQAGLQERKKEAARVEAIIEAEVARFLAWWQALEMVPTIVALRQRAEDVRQEELAEAFRLLRDLSPEEQQRVDALTRAIVNKMLHHPIVQLKASPNGFDYAKALKELFKLPPLEPS